MFVDLFGGTMFS